MTEKLSKKALKIFGGSAVAGMGFSFGRDIYRKITKKDNLGMLVLIMILVLSFLGAFTGGVWITRNYPKIFESIWRRIVALLIMLPSCCVLSLTGLMLFASAENNDSANPVQSEDSIAYMGMIIPPASLVLGGLFTGLSQRKKRSRLWRIEEENNDFMQGHGLIEGNENTLEDVTTGQAFRIEHVGKTAITLFPIGRRGKRAYIRLSDDGTFIEYTGMVKV